MSEAEDKKELGAVARSIDALFADAGTPVEGGPAATEAVPSAEHEAPRAAEDEASGPGGGAAFDDAQHTLDDGVADPPEALAQAPEASPEPAEEPAAGTGEPTAAADTPPVILEEGDPSGASVPPAATDGEEEVMWEAVADEPPAVPQPPSDTTDPDRFTEAIERFLASPPLDRSGQAVELRSMITSLREQNALDPLANAVERIVLSSGESGDEVALAIADSMVSAGVASRIVARLGVERDESRRAELMVVTKEIGLEMAVALSDALSDTTDSFARRTFMDAMIHLGPTAMVVLEQMVDERSWFVVRNAVAILGEVGGDRAVELVTSALANTDARVRREALLALAKIGGEDAGLLVYGMLDDSDPKVRLAAAMAAGALKVERALKPLLALLDSDPEPDVTMGVIRALGQLGDPGAVQAIEKFAVTSFLNRNPTDIRIAAYRALHHIGTPHAMKVVNQALEDKDPEVRETVHGLLRPR